MYAWSLGPFYYVHTVLMVFCINWNCILLQYCLLAPISNGLYICKLRHRVQHIDRGITQITTLCTYRQMHVHTRTPAYVHIVQALAVTWTRNKSSEELILVLQALLLEHTVSFNCCSWFSAHPTLVQHSVAAPYSFGHVRSPIIRMVNSCSMCFKPLFNQISQLWTNYA